MVSKYDLHWIRKKPGWYRLSNGNYEIRKTGDIWSVYHFNIMFGNWDVVDYASSYNGAKILAMHHRDKMIDKALKGLSRKR